MRLATVNQCSSEGGRARCARALVGALADTYPDDLEITLFTDTSALERDGVREIRSSLDEE